jgi:hypothetical protein
MGLVEQYLADGDEARLLRMLHLDPEGQSAVPALGRGLGSPDPEVVRRALRGLRKYDPRGACFVERATQLLDHEQRWVRFAAIKCLLSMHG